MLLSDLAKYSMTWSIMRSLCNSWASCFLQESRNTNLHTNSWRLTQLLTSMWYWCCTDRPNVY